MTASMAKLCRILDQSSLKYAESDLARAFDSACIELNATAIQELSVRVPVALQWISHAGNLIYIAEFGLGKVELVEGEGEVGFGLEESAT